MQNVFFGLFYFFNYKFVHLIFFMFLDFGFRQNMFRNTCVNSVVWSVVAGSLDQFSFSVSCGKAEDCFFAWV